MASNTLLSGDLARRNKSKESEQKTESIECNNNVKEVEEAKDNKNDNDSSNQSPQQQESNICDQKTVKCGNYRNSALVTLALQDIIGIDSLESSHDSTKVGTNFSKDKSVPTMVFSKAPIGSKMVTPLASISMSHLPVFAAWSDA